MKISRQYSRILILCFAVFLSSSARTEYVANTNISTSNGAINTILFKQVSAGIESAVEAGVKSVTKEILTSLGKSLLASYAPVLVDLFFGGDSEIEIATQRILEEVNANHSDLSRRHRILLDEVIAQYRVDLMGTVASATNALEPLLSTDDIDTRVILMADATAVLQELDQARETIEAYVNAGATPDIVFKRMALLPIHITAAQLSVVAARFHYGAAVFQVEFSRTGLPAEQFSEWLNGLDTAQIERLDAENTEFEIRKNNIYNSVLAFYERLSRSSAIDDYVDSKFTPPVSHMVEFMGNTAMYDNPEVIRNPASWAVEPGRAAAILDGVRYYYYVDIPNAQCIEGYAFDALQFTSTVPWRETEEPWQSSECNRYWVVDLTLNSTGWPNTYLSSVDRFGLWFDSPQDVHSLHKTLVSGDLLRTIYGPVSLIIDRIHWEQHRDVRPRNAWDNVFREYDRQVALLGTGDGYNDGVEYSDAVAAARLIAEYGGNDLLLGLADWFAAVRQAVVEPVSSAQVLQVMQAAHENHDWLYSPSDLNARQLRLALVGENNLVSEYADVDDFRTLEVKMNASAKQLAAAKFASIM